MLVTRQKLANSGHEPPFFVDWLSLHQDHAEELPVISAGVVWATDNEGELKWKTIKPHKVEGSHDTSIQVRCDGHRVSLSGNFSRFGRRDNVFGFGLDGCIERANGVLLSLGLPAFTVGEKFYRHVRTQSGPVLKAAWTGASITRIDLTGNFETGSLQAARGYLEWLSTQQASARVKVGTHGDGETVDWGRGSRALYSKAYLKSAELHRHGGDTHLIDHCEKVGLVRFEVTVKSTWLHNAGMNFLGALDMGELIKLYQERTSVLTRAEHTHDDLHQLPNALRRTARDWLAGDDMEKHMSDRTFRRHRSQLLAYGIDIAVRRNVVDFKPRVRVIEVRPASVPTWYDFGERQAA